MAAASELELEPGESVTFSQRVSQVRSKWATSSTAGRLVVTDKRVLFRPNGSFRALGRHGWELRHEDITQSELQPIAQWVLIFGRFWFTGIQIEVTDGSNRVLVPKPKIAAQTLSAIEAASDHLA